MSPFATTRTGDALHRQHQATLAALDDLEDLLHGARPAATPALRERLTRLAEVLEEDVTRHFQFEEEHVFPVLAQAGAVGMVEMLTGEHAIIRPLAQEVRRLAQAAAAEGAFSADAWSAFKEVAGEMIEREVFHVQKEEMGLLAALSQVLDGDRDAALAAMHDRP
jgi:iron-sulfur cluster repair protein YtfE (RIC family)